jgi:hypothetical protein
VANSSSYNVRNIQQIKPFDFANADLLELMNQSVQYKIARSEKSDIPAFEVIVAESPFKSELAGLVEISLPRLHNSGLEFTELKDLSNGKVYRITSKVEPLKINVKIGESTKLIYSN